MLSLPKPDEIKIRENYQISFHIVLKTRQYHRKVLAESFDLNGDIVGFHPV